MKKFKTNKKIKLACSDYNKLLDAKKDIDAEMPENCRYRKYPPGSPHGDP